MLFDDFTRTQMGPSERGASLFDWLNTSARPDIHAMREMVEAWFQRLSDADRAELRGRLRSKEDRQHLAAFFELYLHELLTRMNFAVETHPQMADDIDTRPDFLVKQGGLPVFYLEATLAAESDEEAAASRIIDAAYDALDRMDSPDFFLAIRVEGKPRSPVPVRKGLRRELEKWIGGLNYEEVARIASTGRIEQLPEFSWFHEGWSLFFRVIAKGPAARGKPNVRPIGMVSDGASWCPGTHEAICRAIVSKSGKYGRPALPYVVAVNVLDKSGTDREDMWLGLTTAWKGESGPRRTRVSAAVICEVWNPLSTMRNTPALVHNPWAESPLPPNLWLLSQWRIGPAELERIELPAKEAPDLLGIG